MLGHVFGDVEWPECGEIDIAEWGMKDAIETATLHTKVASAVHYQSTSGQHRNDFDSFTLGTDEPAFHEDFHKYTLDWTPEYVRMYVDGRLIFQRDLSICDLDDQGCSELQHPHFLILNLAVGGAFTGVSLPTSNGGEMLVDYIRAYDNGSGSFSVRVTPCDGPCQDLSGVAGTSRSHFWCILLLVLGMTPALFLFI